MSRWADPCLVVVHIPSVALINVYQGGIGILHFSCLGGPWLKVAGHDMIELDNKIAVTDLNNSNCAIHFFPLSIFVYFI